MLVRHRHFYLYDCITLDYYKAIHAFGLSDSNVDGHIDVATNRRAYRRLLM